MILIESGCWLKFYMEFLGLWVDTITRNIKFVVMKHLLKSMQISNENLEAIQYD